MTVVALPGVASAAPFTVNATNDAIDTDPGNPACLTIANTCTLRAAIQQANASFGQDEISVPAGTYDLVGTGLSVTGSVTITGSGARQTIIDGASNTTVLSIGGDSTIRGLTLTGGWNGLSVNGAEARLDEVTIRDNTMTLAGPAFGAGIYVGSTGKVIMSRSAITGNRVTSSGLDAQGGGVYVLAGGQFTATSSTIMDNSAAAPGVGRSSFGGGIMSLGGAVTLRHVTLANNSSTSGSAAQYGGNVYVQGAGPLTLENSIVAGGVSGSGANCAGPAPRVVLGRNIDSGTTCALGAGQLSSTNPQLESLADHGGPTNSAALKPSSPARDAALACPAGGLDQRGSLAPAGPACDIGAVELGADLAVAAEASRADVAAGGDVTYLVRVTNNGADRADGAVLDVTAAGAAGVTVASASQGTCTTAVRCDLGVIARGATVTTTIVVRAGASGPIAMTARAASALPDPTAGNDSAALATAVAGSTAAAADRTRPVLGSLKLARKPRSGRAVGLRASLSEAATVRLTVTRLVTGRRVGARCTAGARRGRACTISRPTGTVSVSAMSGTPPLTIPAKLKRRPLSPGRYRISAVATDAAGNRSATRTLTIVVKR